MSAKKEILIAWLFLIGAIVFEVIGTSFLKMENKIFGYFFMTLFIAFSYFLMGLAIKKNSNWYRLCGMGAFRDDINSFGFFYIV